MTIIISKIKKYIKVLLSYLILLFWIIRPRTNNHKTKLYLFGVAKWKHELMKFYFDKYSLTFVPFGSKFSFLKYELAKHENIAFGIWGYNESLEVLEYAEKNNIKVIRIEDGFVRSKGLGSLHALPYSLCVDEKGMYFDATQPSELEDILNTYDFSEDTRIIEQAKICMGKLINQRISKYNHLPSKDVQKLYGPKKQKRILVIGQVEEDASIKKGML
ncbi:capsular polysaccharide export protein, LipB/KpsS family [Bacillus sp. m3-13]|uniref:capsular polysaccharide export protein, LipB/KpsS family n=1 Tax=Bacillus sp. m3-13 TaxID=406124 RepID=UPI0001E89E3C|nr:capsule polysaccharide export protein [Bacillus sp. m3-13]